MVKHLVFILFHYLTTKSLMETIFELLQIEEIN